MICLLPHCGYLSETTRMLELHRALRDRGAPVRLATHGGTYESLLGDDFDRIDPPMTAERCATFVRDGIGLGSPDQSMYSDDELRASVAAEARYFTRNDVRVTVTGFTLSTLLSTRLAQVELVTEHAGSFVPPIFEHGLAPLPRERQDLLPGLPYYCAGFNRVAAENGLPPMPGLASLLLGDLTLVPEIPEVLGLPDSAIDDWVPAPGSPYRPETRLRCTGPLFAHLDHPIPAEVRRFLAQPRPLIYVAITSSPPDLVRAVLEALAPLAVRVLVAATVHPQNIFADVTGAANFLVAGVLPSHRIMPDADLVITAGGQGSVQTAMACGAPLLALPLQPEQELNVALVQRLNAARSIAATGNIRGTARTMLEDPRYRAAAQRIQRLYDQVDGPGAAADAILELHDA
ncbi:glycosyltransferase [Cryptosporangium sp. NPDC051539]|uniref:glycosyltransferase n=1 Tax=Cryptosporangium sp. NPDC051539 TaxID=3363962 RepID=UPI0037A78DB6